jgi:uncharacterized protein (TIGR02391 family)
MEQAIEGAAGEYARARVSLAANALGTVITTKRACLRAADIAEVFEALVPNKDELLRFIYSNVQGIGAPTGIGIGQSVETQYRLAVEEQTVALKLLACDPSSVSNKAKANTGPEQYSFHPAIEACAGDLFRDGHYKAAALESYICVIEAVRNKSGIPADGDDLMNQAFGAERRTPRIQVNELKTDAERDEQKGFMYLFKGVVGLRNSKAHSNRLFNDASRAHEYLALSSLLLRILEISSVNPGL